VAFGARWRDATSTLRRWVPFVFLEYDAEAAVAPVAVPSVFAALDSPLARRGEYPDLAAAREVVSLLRGCATPASLDAQLATCFERLPARGHVLHVAVMLGRAERSVRISVLIPRDAVESYFTALGASETARGAVALLGYASERDDCCQLDFDIGPPIAARVGLGLRPDHADGWESLVEGLVRIGVDDATKLEALLRWPGVTMADTPGGSILLRRELSHVKLGWQPSGIEAKAYLGATRLTSGPACP
jgi:hypothetical protein